MKNFKGIKLLLSMVMMASLLSPIQVSAKEEDKASVTILQSSDLHGYVNPYDYASDIPAKSGLAKIATIVKQERAKDENVLLIDTGDTLQGNMVDSFRKDDIHPMIKAMNLMGYDLWTLGNHEFNYDFKDTTNAMNDFKGNIAIANIYKKDGSRWQEPYHIFDVNGVKVAIFGLVAPHVPEWEASDASRYDNMKFTDPVEETGKVLKELEGKADLIIGNIHYGREGEKGTLGVNEIARVYGDQLDGLFVGHAHESFAEEVNGVLMAEPGSNGTNVSKMNFELEKVDGNWQVTNKKVELVSTKEVEADPELLKEMAYYDEKAKAMANEKAGEIAENFFEDTSYLPGIPRVYVEDNALIDLINKVQLLYSGADVSMAATFGDYLNLEKGDFKVKDAVKIYKYDNTLYGVKINGKTLKTIMENQAGNFFNQAKTGDVTPSFNPDMKSYMFDSFAGVDYDINISKPAGQRIENIKFKGEPLKEDQELILAVNNYRFGNLEKAGLVSKADIVFDSNSTMPSAIRDMALDYVKNQKVISPECDHNWKITGVDTTSDVAVMIHDKVRKGEIEIADRTKALNMYDLSDAGKIPHLDRPTEEVPTEPTEKPTESTYTVVAGDCLWNIALKYNTTYQKIAQLNGIEAPYLIFPGQKLVIG